MSLAVAEPPDDDRNDSRKDGRDDGRENARRETAMLLTGLPKISAQELHVFLLETHTTANTSRRRFMHALRAMDEGKLYLPLGYPNIAAYGEAVFRFRKSQTYEYLRVARAFDGLQQIASAYETGKLSFSLVAELTRVAVDETEAEWLELALSRRPGEVRAEVLDALRNKRTLPRKDGGFGLPGLPIKVILELSPEDHAIVEQALTMTVDEMAAGLDGVRPSLEQALVYLASKRLEEQPSARAISESDGEPEAAAAGSKSKDSCPYTVVFTQCSDCKRAAVESSDGRVAIDPESLRRFSGSATCIEIDRSEDGELPSSLHRDRANTPKLRREVRARAGGRCENPCCRRQTRGGGHAHHIVFRADGGPTELANSVHVCERCHGLIHAGCLTVTGNPDEGLEWRPRALDIERAIRTELDRTRSFPEIRTVVRDSGKVQGIPKHPDRPETNPPSDRDCSGNGA